MDINSLPVKTTEWNADNEATVQFYWIDAALVAELEAYKLGRSLDSLSQQVRDGLQEIANQRVPQSNDAEIAGALRALYVVRWIQRYGTPVTFSAHFSTSVF